MPLLDTVYSLEKAGRVSLQQFKYSTPMIDVPAASGGAQGAIAIQSDSHFVVRYGAWCAYTGSAGSQVVAATSPPLLIQFFDTASGRTLFDHPQPIQSVLGGMAAANAFGTLPYMFPEPWLIRGAGSVQVTLTNLGNTHFTGLIVTFDGFKVYPVGSAGLPNI